MFISGRIYDDGSNKLVLEFNGNGNAHHSVPKYTHRKDSGGEKFIFKRPVGSAKIMEEDYVELNPVQAKWEIPADGKLERIGQLISVSKTAFTRCRHILKTVKKVTAAKFELAFTRYRHNLKTAGNLAVKIRCRTLMLKKRTYTLRIDQSRSKSVEKCSVYIIVECSHDAVSNLYRLGFRFENLPFSKSTGKKCAIFV